MSSNGKAGSAFPSGAVTRQELKRMTGQFDLESVFQFDASGQSLTGVGCLAECLGIEFLNLSDNQLTDLSMLSGLKRLRFLNVSANKLSSTAGLGGCEQLEALNMAGNLIACTEDLQPLCALEHLRSLQLQDRQAGTANPLCMSSSYVAKVTELLPQLTDLDGDRVRGGGDEYRRLCEQVDRALAGDTGGQLRGQPGAGGSGLGDSYWSMPSANEERAASERAEAEFNAAVSRVRDLELRAMLCIEQCERDLRKQQRI